jgi:hypothetical protein
VFKLLLGILALAAVAVAAQHYGLLDGLLPTMRGGIDSATGRSAVDFKLHANETLARKRLERAVRAHRAVHGRLPQDLRELVRDGQLDAGDLHDEWGREFTVERDAGVLRVRSAGRDGHFDTSDDWTLEWTAPDA